MSQSQVSEQLDLGVEPKEGTGQTSIALPCDKWIASSALQKAIRRGHGEIAQRAALTLHEADPRSVWRRLLIIAFEDIGVGSPETLINTTLLASNAEMRVRLGGEQAAILRACQLLAEAPKDRSTDYLIAAAMHDPRLEAVREECGGNPVAQRLEIVADHSRPLLERCVASWYASGVEAWPERRVGRGDFDGLIRTFADLGAPENLLDAVRVAVRKTREPIVGFLPLLWLAASQDGDAIEGDPLPPTELVDGVPLCALDGHTRLGRQAIERFRHEDPDVEGFLSEHVPDFRADKALRLAVFFADSALIRPRLAWRHSRELERLGVAADFHGARIDPSIGGELTKLVRQNLAHLNAIRAELIRGLRHAF